MKKNILILFLLISPFYKSYAQDSTKTSKFHFYAGLNLTTVPTLNISGIDTSFVNSLSIGPSLTISYHGFSVIYSPKFVTGGSNSGIYMHAITAGYAQYDKPNVDFALEYTHMFFTNNASVPYSPLNNEIYTGIAFKKFWIRPEISAGLGFGNTKATSTSTAGSAYDFGLSTGIGHSFEWDNGGVSYNVLPSVLLNGGTNQYFSYLKISKYIGSNKNFGNFTKKGTGANRGNGKKTVGGTSTSTSPTTTGEAFSISNVEVNLEASAEIGSFTVRPTVSLYVPVGTAGGSGITTFWQLALQYEF
nr:hypothetical protein [Pseudopedobacter sp.]